MADHPELIRSIDSIHGTYLEIMRKMEEQVELKSRAGGNRFATLRSLGKNPATPHMPIQRGSVRISLKRKLSS